MPVYIAYFTVVAIWSTTPLGIVWSGQSVDPVTAVMLRTAIAAPLALLLAKLFKVKVPWHKEAIKLYGYCTLNIYLGMLLTYISAKVLPSGLISLVYGLAPMVTGLLAQKILHEAKFGRARQIALAIAFTGLIMVCSDNIALQGDHWLSLVILLVGMFFFSLSGVMVKSVKLSIHPLANTVGGLWLSLPLFLVSWYLLEGTMPTTLWTGRSIAAIVYLGVFGSLVGFVAYYYVLQKLPAATVGLITLLTPVIALMLGNLLNAEAITTNVMLGAFCILLGLAIYQFGEKWFKPATQLTGTEKTR